MPRKKTSAPSKGAAKVEEKKVRQWTEDEEKKLKKYYTLYEGLEDSFYLISAMISETTAEVVAVKLKDMNLITEDVLYNTFPHLDKENDSAIKRAEVSKPKVATTKSTTSKQKSTQSAQKKTTIEDAQKFVQHLIETTSNSSELFAWVKEKIEEACVTRELHKISVEDKDDASTSKNSKLSNKSEASEYVIVPLNEKEWKFVRNRWLRKIFLHHKLELCLSKEDEDRLFDEVEREKHLLNFGLWSIPPSVSSQQLRSFILFLKDAGWKAEAHKKRIALQRSIAHRQAVANKENNGSNGSSWLSKSFDVVPNKEVVKKRVFKKSPLKPLQKKEAPVDDLDAIFASPVHKKTKGKTGDTFFTNFTTLN